MTTAQAILEQLRTLPDSLQQEVLNFVKSLTSRRTEARPAAEDAAWSQFSLAAALRDMEDEDTPYTVADLKEPF